MGVRWNCMQVFIGWAGVLMFAVSPFAVGQAAAPNSADHVLAHLNEVLRWSRAWESPDVTLVRPGDELYVENGQSLAQQVVNLEFQSALAQAARMGQTSSKNAQAGNSSQKPAGAQNILNSLQRVGQQMQDLQTQLDTVNVELVHARAKDRPALLSRQDTLQGQLQLAQALQDNLEKLTSFMNMTESASGAANELTGKILALKRARPAPAASASSGKQEAKTTPALTVSPQNTGLIEQMGELFHFVQSLRTLDQMSKDTDKLLASTQQLRAPLLAALRTTLQQGQVELSNASPGNPTAGHTAAPATTAAATAQAPDQQGQAMAALVQHFKLLSNATLPLSQELILLNQSQANLGQLQNSIKHDYISILRTLLLKAGGILIALAFIWLFSELWRRATFRYIRDARRRRQFLVLRRVVTGFCMFVVILLGFVSDFSSLATYAGLITAGVAVALQAVILSVAAYFFLVGRYGVKVGDRVTVVYSGNNSVAGDVMDIGLIRFYMMELAGAGVDMQPTGRICVFPNSVLFQTNPLFKQMPGTEYAWREIALPLSPDSDGQLAEKELMAVVESIYSSYAATLQRQHLSIETTMGISMNAPKPYPRVRFIASGTEAMVRYPIPLRQSAALDDRMVTEVSEMLRKNPSIKLAAGASPDLRSPVKA